MTFQYPRTDRTGCNLKSSAMAKWPRRPFSILGRIERDATNRLKNYRIGFNQSFSILGRIERDATLTIPFSLSQAMLTFSILGRIERDATLSPVCRWIGPYNTFSILGRIERDATTEGPPRCGGRGGPLSVSSDGSNGMQRSSTSPDAFSILGRIERDATAEVPVVFLRLFGAFSSLGRIERDATMNTVYVKYKCDPLSVSSDGSNGMQRRSRPSWAEVDRTTFSILGRIERDATLPRRPTCPAPMSFQYPRTDRTGCNSGRESAQRLSSWPFSILGRIERDATSGNHRIAWRPHAAFSILGRIERDATSFQGPGSRVERYLSVSSDGSNGMQLVGFTVPAPQFPGFQYPRTDRTGCNPHPPGCLEQPVSFDF